MAFRLTEPGVAEDQDTVREDGSYCVVDLRHAQQWQQTCQHVPVYAVGMATEFEAAVEVLNRPAIVLPFSVGDFLIWEPLTDSLLAMDRDKFLSTHHPVNLHRPFVKKD